MHPDVIARYQVAREQGAAASIAYPGEKNARGRTVYTLTMCIAGGIVTFAQCPHGDPFGVMRRVLVYRARHGY
jgi:hypothetical protein